MNYIASFKNVTIEYQMKHVNLKAVDNATLNLVKGKITALVGESGSGKTTLATALLNCLTEPGVITDGEVLFYENDGEPIDIVKLNTTNINQYRWMQTSMVFQGAQSSLNPVIKIFDQFYETIKVHKPKTNIEEARKIAHNCLEIVNLDVERILESYPHELSGGMKQRVMIAFALLLDPKIIILDEPTTALDVITQDYIFSILKKINQETHVTMLLLTHDIAVVSKYSDYLAVMYGGKIMEYGETEKVFEYIYHPYTKGLINATPSLLKNPNELSPIPGNPPNLLDMPTGCVFHPRCDKCMQICPKKEPKDIMIDDEHLVKCFLYLKEINNG